MKTFPESIVDRLLEADEGIDDPRGYAMGTAQPDSNMIQDTLRDELVERDWRQIQIRADDDGEWVAEANVIDNPHRAKWQGAGARVAPTPEETPQLRMLLMRQFRAAAKRVGMKVETANIESLQPSHEGLDLDTQHADIEDDQGDWHIAIRFRWAPDNKFWSKASQALGYETKPYQRPAKPAAPTRPAGPSAPHAELPRSRQKN